MGPGRTVLLVVLEHLPGLPLPQTHPQQEQPRGKQPQKEELHKPQNLVDILAVCVIVEYFYLFALMFLWLEFLIFLTRFYIPIFGHCAGGCRQSVIFVQELV